MFSVFARKRGSVFSPFKKVLFPGSTWIALILSITRIVGVHQLSDRFFLRAPPCGGVRFVIGLPPVIIHFESWDFPVHKDHPLFGEPRGYGNPPNGGSLIISHYSSLVIHYSQHYSPLFIGYPSFTEPCVPRCCPSLWRRSAQAAPGPRSRSFRSRRWRSVQRGAMKPQEKRLM